MSKYIHGYSIQFTMTGLKGLYVLSEEQSPLNVDSNSCRKVSNTGSLNSLISPVQSRSELCIICPDSIELTYDHIIL